MGVAVDDRLHMIEAIDRLAQPLRAEILEDRWRLAFEGAPGWGIMEERPAALGAELPQLVFELARLVHRLIDERLDDRLAEWRELTASEAAEEALYPRKPDAFDFGRLLVENLHPRRVEDF